MVLWNDYVVICIKIYISKGGLWDNYVAICIKIYNLKGSKKLIMLLSALIYITLKVVKYYVVIW